MPTGVGKDQRVKLVLASTSPYRAALLRRLRVPFEQASPGVDEDSFKDGRLLPQELARLLAREKARAVAARMPDALVLGGDQVAEVGGRILGKPGTSERALEQLMAMNGREHRLLTAVHLQGPGFEESHLDVTTLTMRALDEAQLREYVRRDTPLDCAGAYKLEAAGIKLFAKLETRDPDAIVGLPLIWLQGALLRAGLPFF